MSQGHYQTEIKIFGYERVYRLFVFVEMLIFLKDRYLYFLYQYLTANFNVSV